MPIPPFHEFMRPCLAALADGEERSRRQVRDLALASAQLSDEDLAETMRGGNKRAENRAEWAIEYLAQAGAIDRPSRGRLRISTVGRDLLAAHVKSISVADLEPLDGYQRWLERSRAGANRRKKDDHGATADTLLADETTAPIEQLIEALDVLDAHTAQSLVERLRELPPIFLERAVLKLLHAMGYGGSEDDGEHLGQSHDGGLDGVIKQDALGLERVYVQAKRYAHDNTVGSAAIREFVGALTGVGASGGVFITTSKFSTDALKYVERLTPRVILIDGAKLGRLMVDYGVGVQIVQTLKVSEVDQNFFESDL